MLKKIIFSSIIAALYASSAFSNNDVIYEFAFKYLLRGDQKTFYEKIYPYAEQENPGAMFGIGNQNLKNKEYEKAITWYEKAILKGNGCAANNLGLMYARGSGVPQSIDLTQYWLKVGSDLGDGRSTSNYAGVLAEKNPHDKVTLLSLYKLALEQGEPCGAYHLGELYNGADKSIYNKEKAYFYFLLSRWVGLVGCPFYGSKELATLKKILGREKSTAIESEVAKWKTLHPLMQIQIRTAQCFKSQYKR